MKVHLITTVLLGLLTSFLPGVHSKHVRHMSKKGMEVATQVFDDVDVTKKKRMLQHRRGKTGKHRKSKKGPRRRRSKSSKKSSSSPTLSTNPNDDRGGGSGGLFGSTPNYNCARPGNRCLGFYPCCAGLSCSSDTGKCETRTCGSNNCLPTLKCPNYWFTDDGNHDFQCKAYNCPGLNGAGDECREISCPNNNIPHREAHKCCVNIGKTGKTLHENFFIINFDKDDAPEEVRCEPASSDHGKVFHVSDGQPYCHFGASNKFDCFYDNNRLVIRILAGRHHTPDVWNSYNEKFVALLTSVGQIYPSAMLMMSTKNWMVRTLEDIAIPVGVVVSIGTALFLAADTFVGALLIFLLRSAVGLSFQLCVLSGWCLIIGCYVAYKKNSRKLFELDHPDYPQQESPLALDHPDYPYQTPPPFEQLDSLDANTEASLERLGYSGTITESRKLDDTPTALNFWQSFNMTMVWQGREHQINDIHVGQFSEDTFRDGHENPWVFFSPYCAVQSNDEKDDKNLVTRLLCTGGQFEVNSGDSHKSIWISRTSVYRRCTDEIWKTATADTDGTGVHTCGGRITWLILKDRKSEKDACNQVKGEFSECTCNCYDL